METLSAHSRTHVPQVSGRRHVEISSESGVVGLTRPTTSPSSNKQAPAHQRSHPPASLARGLGTTGYVPVQASTAPDSQESSTSTTSSASGVPRLQTASSNVSQITVNTDLTSPTSPSSVDSQSQTGPEKSAGQSIPHKYAPGTTTTVTGSRTQPRTPEPEPGTHTQVVPGSGTKSPVTVITPVNGTKRTADGMVKSAGTVFGSPAQVDVAGRSRAESLSSSGSKASEAAASLKTRLAYAMAKVQHGWEHKNIDQVERLAAQLSPRPSQTSPNGGRHIPASPRSAAFPRPQSSGLSNGTARLSMHEAYGQLSPPQSAYSYAPSDMASPPSKRHSGNSLASWASQSHQHHSLTSLGPSLAPAAEIRPSSSNRRASSGRLPPHLGSIHGGSPISPPHYAATSSIASNPPQTPRAPLHRPSTLRTKTQTQQAEQDAMDALMLMGSPNNKNFPQNRGSQQSSALPSPLRTEFPRTAKAWAKRSESNESSLSAMSQESLADAAGAAAAKEVTGRVLDEAEEG